MSKKINNMNIKHIFKALLSIMILSVVFIGCSRDDDKNDPPRYKEDKIFNEIDIIGSWIYEGVYVPEGIYAKYICVTNSPDGCFSIDFLENKFSEIVDVNYNNALIGQWRFDGKNTIKCDMECKDLYTKEIIRVQLEYKIIELSQLTVVLKVVYPDMDSRIIKYNKKK